MKPSYLHCSTQGSVTRGLKPCHFQMAAGSASDQPRETAVQPPLADDYVVEANGNQRARPTAEVLRNQPLLERAAALQINQISKCITILEAMRTNLNRMETALVLLETGVVEQLNRETLVEDLEVPTEVIDEKPEDELINQGTEQDNQILDKPDAGVSNLPPEPMSVTTESVTTELGIPVSPALETEEKDEKPAEKPEAITAAELGMVPVNLEESEEEATVEAAPSPKTKRSRSQGSPPPTGGAESSNQPRDVNQINQAALASPRQPQEGAGRDRREPTLPSLPNQRMAWNLCPGQPSTVFIEGLKDSTSELTYVEWLNSLGGLFNRRCTAISAVSIGMIKDEARQPGVTTRSSRCDARTVNQNEVDERC